MSRHYKRIPICRPPTEPHLCGQVNSPAHGLSSGVADGGSGFLLAQFHALDSASLKKGRWCLFLSLTHGALHCTPQYLNPVLTDMLPWGHPSSKGLPLRGLCSLVELTSLASFLFPKGASQRVIWTFGYKMLISPYFLGNGIGPISSKNGYRKPLAHRCAYARHTHTHPLKKAPCILRVLKLQET